jgi:hypothetical protein
MEKRSISMTRDELRKEIEQSLRSSGELYCCYCSDIKDEKISCCSENHFVPFEDLYEDQQEALIEEQLDEWEGNL